jgi:pimeloyl-ACP methyl ester carboxylesterase
MVVRGACPVRGPVIAPTVLGVLVVAVATTVGSAASTVRAPAGYVSVSGHRLYYECSGEGSPTVVLDAGSPDTSATWRWVQPEIARFTRVCAYDRAGLGRSSPARAGRRTARTQVDELRHLLTAARIPGPYIVVGHSWGGFLARLFAHVYPRVTAGAVLVDATTFPYLTSATAARLPRKTTREGIDRAAAVAEAASIKTLGHLPLVVLGSNRPPLGTKLLRAQDAEAALSTDSIDAIARFSTHYIQRPAPAGQPGIVTAAIGAVVDAARSHHGFPPCRQLFRSAAVRCR